MNFIFKKELIDYDFFFQESKKTIVFLHGWGGDKNSFISTCNLLKNNYNILTLTMPTISDTAEVWDMMDYVELVLSLLRTHNVRKIIIICHSFGFRVATLLVPLIKIEKMVITGGAGIKKDNLIKNIESQNTKILLRDKRFKFLYLRVASKDYKDLSNINKLTFKNVVGYNLKNMIKFYCPLLLFWGKDDHETPLFIAKRLKRKNNVKYIVTKGGHFAYLDNNSYFNNEVLRFLNS